MKLPNGFGSVYKLSGNRRNPYRAIVTERWLIDKDTGKWKQKRKTIGYYRTKNEAMIALADYNKSPVGVLNTSRLDQKVMPKVIVPLTYYVILLQISAWQT